MSTTEVKQMKMLPYNCFDQNDFNRFTQYAKTKNIDRPQEFIVEATFSAAASLFYKHIHSYFYDLISDDKFARSPPSEYDFEDTCNRLATDDSIAKRLKKHFQSNAVINGYPAYIHSCKVGPFTVLGGYIILGESFSWEHTVENYQRYIATDYFFTNPDKGVLTHLNNNDMIVVSMKNTMTKGQLDKWNAEFKEKCIFDKAQQEADQARRIAEWRAKNPSRVVLPNKANKLVITKTPSINELLLQVNLNGSLPSIQSLISRKGAKRKLPSINALILSIKPRK